MKSLIKSGSFEEILKQNPDILCLQEVKSENIPEIDGYFSYLFPSEKGINYSGVAVYTKLEPITVKKGFGDKNFDLEGRVIRLEFENFNLYNIYAPTGASSNDDFENKTEFYDKLTQFFEKSNKPSVICGDFNRISSEIDAKNIKNIAKSFLNSDFCNLMKINI